MHLCAKFYANRTIRLRVIQMALCVTDRVTDRQSNRQLHSGHHNTTKKIFQKSFAVKTVLELRMIKIPDRVSGTFSTTLY